MTAIEEIATASAPAALGAYSQAVKANGFVFVSGQLGIDPATGELAGETAAEQAAQSLRNIANILAAAGADMTHVVRTTIYLKNVEDFAEVNARYAEVFTGSVKPARCAFGGNDILRARSSRSTPSPPCDVRPRLRAPAPNRPWTLRAYGRFRCQAARYPWIA